MARVIIIRDKKVYNIPQKYTKKINVSFQRDKTYPYSLIDDDNLAYPVNKDAKQHTVPEYTCRLDDQWHHHGDTIALRIGFKGYPDPVVTWFKDQQAIIPSMKIMLQSTATGSELIVLDAQKSDAGFYTCRIENPLGLRDTNCFIHIGDTDRIKSTGYKNLIVDSRLYRTVVYKPHYYYSRH
ncbi:hypothetical protein FO519_004843 [Halicephalobus sp. NKZ332]|nr:hypothetical protein FO519_004843 [Halicephalobus sp. NKZ332]